MDPTIEAAWIAGGVGALGVVATVITAWIGSRNTRKATERTVEAGAAANRATLTAAREDRLWERRCAAYEETLTALLYRQDKRSWAATGGRWETDAAQELENAYDKYHSTAWFERQGRLSAYASDAVLAASEAAIEADAIASSRSYELRQRAKQAWDVPPPEPDVRTFLQEFKIAHEAGRAADEALIKAIRDELRSRPEAIMTPSALSAVRRGGLRPHRE